MKVTLVSPYSAARGKDAKTQGGVIYPLGGQNIRRSLVQPTNPNTSAQQDVRIAFTDASSAFNAISDSDRTGWKTLASAIQKKNKFGEIYAQTDKGQYVGVNTLRQLNGQSITDTAPVYALAVGPTTITQPNRSTGDPIVITGARLTGAAIYLLEVSPVLPGMQRQARESDLVLASSVSTEAFLTVSTTSYTFSIPEANFRFNWNQSGGRVAVRVTGLTSDYVKGKAFATYLNLDFSP